MTMENQKEQVISQPDMHKNMFRRFLQVAFTLFLTALLLFLSAGKLDWIYAWVYIIAYLLIIIVNAIIFPPELISERGKKKKNVEKWDKVISGLMIIPMLVIYIVAGLDVRFGWSPERSLLSHLTGLVVFLAGVALVSWSMVSNRWFSTAVRIQYDREHSVAVAGPYNYVRHPGYLGMIIYNLATPVLLGSLWAFLPAVIMALLFIIRTKLEDITLKTKLEGYKGFSERVRFRLIPYIW
jgi:protein-S-isoprenylcysteine O-methyltransferase Ste14